MNFIFVFLSLASLTWAIENETAHFQVFPKLKDYAEKTRISKLHPDSKVSITVGEKNGFHYTLSGFTRSYEKVSVSGEYLNNEITSDGYAWLFLGVPSGVEAFQYRYNHNHMEVMTYNYKYDQFLFEIIPPHVVDVGILRISQFNETALLVSGPSRSALFGSKVKELKPTEEPTTQAV